MNILLAEDNADDVFIFENSLRKARPDGVLLRVVSNGEEVIRYLLGEGTYADRQQYPFPSLLFLDLKMPRKNGFEVLEWVRDHPEIERFPIVVLTSSDNQQDIKKAYQFHVSSYLSKTPLVQEPMGLSEVMAYWQDYCQAPGMDVTAPKL